MSFPKGQKQTKEHKEKRIKALSGIKRTQEFKDAISKRMSGRKLSIETIERIKKNRKGKGIGNVNGLGKNIGNKSAFGKTRGSDNGNWQGGKSILYKPNRERIAGRKKPENCEICGRKGIICFDHCHSTGNFRGWICSRCNLALGLVNDSIGVLKKMEKYLERNVF